MTAAIETAVKGFLNSRKVKSYALSAFSDLRLYGQKLYIHQGDTLQKVNLATWMAHAKDWQRLKAILQCSQTGLGSSQSQFQAK